MYAFNFVPVFPTIQADMANKGRFKWVVVISSIVIFALYASLAVFSYKGRYSALSPFCVHLCFILVSLAQNQALILLEIPGTIASISDTEYRPDVTVPRRLRPAGRHREPAAGRRQARGHRTHGHAPRLGLSHGRQHPQPVSGGAARNTSE